MVNVILNNIFGFWTKTLSFSVDQFN